MIFTRSPRARQKNRRAVAVSPPVNRAALVIARVCQQALLMEAKLPEVTGRSSVSDATRAVAGAGDGGDAVEDGVAVLTAKVRAKAQAKAKVNTAIAASMAVEEAVDNAAASPVLWITAIATRTVATIWATPCDPPEAAASNVAEAASVLVAAGEADAAADSSPTFRSR